MTSSKPYLLRAIFEWITDNNLTPYLLVNANYPQVQVPSKYVKNDQIILNIAASATHKFIMNNEVIQFEARFDGVIWQITVPVVAIAALYAQENGRGMVFDEQETEGSGEENPPPTATPPSKPGRPQLKIVK